MIESTDLALPFIPSVPLLFTAGLPGRNDKQAIANIRKYALIYGNRDAICDIPRLFYALQLSQIAVG